jgi:peptidoglycan hydrolase CwlO-like protein
MSKALKTFIILNLAASIAIAVLATLLFMEKELIKSRAIVLRESLASISGNLKWGEELAGFTVEDKQSQNYIVPKPNTHAQLASFKTKVDDLGSFAIGRMGQIEGTHTILVTTQNKLEQTKETLATREQELATARARIVTLNGNIQQKQNELAQANRTISNLRSENAGLETRLEGLNAQMIDRNNQIATLEIDLDSAIKERDLMYENYFKCKFGGEKNQATGEWRGRTAMVLKVNPEWNYVVIDKGTVDNLQNEMTAYVHRGDVYVGKLVVAKVDGTVSIANVVRGSVPEGFEIKPGDSIFF